MSIYRTQYRRDRTGPPSKGDKLLKHDSFLPPSHRTHFAFGDAVGIKPASQTLSLPRPLLRPSRRSRLSECTRDFRDLASHTRLKLQLPILSETPGSWQKHLAARRLILTRRNTGSPLNCPRISHRGTGHPPTTVGCQMVLLRCQEESRRWIRHPMCFRARANVPTSRAGGAQGEDAGQRGGRPS